MIEKRILPFNLNPPYKTYGYLWFPNGIILANFKEAENWILSKNIYLGFSDRRFKVYDRESSFFDYGPLIKEERVFRFYDVICNSELLIKMIEGLICENYYIEGYWNERAISALSAYNRFDFPHIYYLYGFDRKKGELFFAGYTSENKYSPFIVTYDEYIQSIKQYKSDTNRLILTKVNKQFKCRFNPEDVKNAIDDYLKSRCKFVDDTESDYLGINAQNKYIELLEKNTSDKGIDIRNSRLLMEYKNVLLKAIKKCFCFKDEELKELDRIYEYYNVQHLLSIKFNITKNRETLYKIVSKLNIVTQNEKELLEIIMNKFIEVYGF